MPLSDDEQRRLDELSRQVDRQYPWGSRELSDATSTNTKDNSHLGGDPTLLPTTATGIAALIGFVTGLGLFLAGWVAQRPALAVVGALIAAVPAIALYLSRRSGPGM